MYPRLKLVPVMQLKISRQHPSNVVTIHNLKKYKQIELNQLIILILTVVRYNRDRVAQLKSIYINHLQEAREFAVHYHYIS